MVLKQKIEHNFLLVKINYSPNKKGSYERNFKRRAKPTHLLRDKPL
jgi:hypothetical protein